MENFVNEQVKILVQELQAKQYLDCSLFAGDLGKVLCLFIISSSNKKLETISYSLLSKLLQNTKNSHNIKYTYCNGLAGLGTSLMLLQKYEYIRGAQDSLFNYDFILSKILSYFIQNQNFDFLHGAIGIGFYFLRRTQNLEFCKKQVSLLINKLYLCAIKRYIHSKQTFKWLFYNPYRGYDINISLSHGMSSIAIFASKAYHFIDDPTTKTECCLILDGIQSYYKQIILNPKERGCYSASFPEKDDYSRSRLGWCYGDIGVSLALNNIGICLNDKNCVNLAHDIAVYAAMQRRSCKLNSITDGALCHGIAGVGIFFDHCYNRYNENIFKEAHNYWHQLLIHNLSAFLTPTNNLLDGTSGIICFISQNYNLIKELMLYE
jgi:hypothetical protein